MTERSLLYVPADQPAKLAKALGRGADGIIVDLEDGVAPAAKTAAREAAVAWLTGLDAAFEGGPSVWVRVNAGADREPDLFAVGALPAVTGIVLAKTETAAELVDVDRLLTTAGSRARVCPLIESASGVLALAALAVAPRVSRLLVGEADLSAELGVRLGDDERELLWVRSQLVLVSAAQRLDPPLGPVSVDFRDLDRLRTSSEALRRLGFAGRSCIHPAQVGVVNDAFTPSVAEAAAAAAVVRAFDAAGGGVLVGADGRMVDEAVVRQARRVLSAGRAGE